MNSQAFEAEVAKIVKVYGITANMACEADEACDDFERGSDAWFDCFKAAIENLIEDEADTE